MSTRFIRWFDELGRGDRETVGGKCASLGELGRLGLDVPAGFAVTVAAFEVFRDVGDLRSELDAIAGGVDPAAANGLAAAYRQAAALIGARALPEGVEREVRAAYAELCHRLGAPELPVAVRSSAVAEDGAAASFAGQQDSYLCVRGGDAVVDRVRSCWAGLYTPQALAYRAGLSWPAVDLTRMSVAVQAMVDAEVSGVAFTVSPRTGDRSVVAVNASWGLGHGIVSGEVTPDEYQLSKIGCTLTSSTIAHKTTQWVPAAAGGVMAAPVPAERQDVACLAAGALRRLVEIAVSIERHFGVPQDIEWALTAGCARIVVLQSRPETSWQLRRSAARARYGASYLSVIQRAAGGSA